MKYMKIILIAFVYAPSFASEKSRVIQFPLGFAYLQSNTKKTTVQPTLPQQPNNQTKKNPEQRK